MPGPESIARSGAGASDTLLRLAQKDLARRARDGVPFYFLLWLLIVLFSGIGAERPLPTYTVGALTLAIGVARLITIRRFDRLYDHSVRRWRLAFGLGAAAAASTWAAFCGVTMVGRPLDVTAISTVLATAGLGAGAIISYAPSRAMFLTMVSLLVLPLLPLILLTTSEGTLGMAILVAAFYAYVLRASRTSHQEYWSALRANAKLEELAARDALTGAINRRKFDELLAQEMERAHRYRLPLALVLFDIDHFKRVNDNYGHRAGDDLLSALTALAGGHIRVSDALARWGGEEFALIAPGSDLEAARRLAENLRALIEHADFGRIGAVTCSFGAAQFQAGDTPEQLTARADEALYRAKRGGRNRVETAPPGA